MSFSRYAKTAIVISSLVIVLTAGLVTQRLYHWSHTPWTGILYLPAVAGVQGLNGIGPGSVVVCISGGPGCVAGVRSHDRLLSINNISTGDLRAIAQLDDSVVVGQELTVSIQRGRGQPQEIRFKADSPLHSPAVRFSFSSGIIVAFIFLVIGAFVFLHKPEDARAMVFLVLSVSAGTSFTLLPLYYFDVWGGHGVRSLAASMHWQQWCLWILTYLLTFGVIVLMTHLSLIFPRPRPILRSHPKLLWWLYTAPLLQWAAGLLPPLMASLPKTPRVIALAVLWGAGLLIAGYLVREWRRMGSASGITNHPLLGFVGCFSLPSATVLTLIALLPSTAGRKLLGWYGFLSFGLGLLTVFISYAVISLVSLARSYRECGIEEKKQIRWPMWGIAVTLGGTTLLSLLQMLVSFAAPTLVLPTIISDAINKLLYLAVPLSFGAAILKYRLMEIDLFIRKTIVYSIISGAIVCIYLLLVGGLGRLVVQTANVTSPTLIMVATLATAGLFVPLRNRVQRVVDLRFRRKSTDLPRALRALTTRMSENTELFSLLNVVAEQLVQLLQARNTVIFRKSLREQDYQMSASIGLAPSLAQGLRLPRSTQLLAGHTGPFPVDEVTSGPESQLLKSLSCAMVVPLFHRNEPIGFISVGQKLSRDAFEQEEIEFLAGVADGVANAIYNLRWRQQEQEFKEAQDIQEGLLPKEIPQIPGIEVAGSWRPARIVGGDYFDVLRFSDTRMAVCIADVSGKGISAALLMSNLQAVVRAFAAEHVRPRDLMSKVNRLMCANIMPGRFVTVFYALLDTAQEKITFCNAGHNPPLLVHEDNSWQRLNAGGSIVAAFSDAHYEEQQIALQPGDRLVMFTDGVTEAANADQAEFSEERLIETLLACQSLSTWEFQSRLLDQISAWTGGEFQDDATVLVLSVAKKESVEERASVVAMQR